MFKLFARMALAMQKGRAIDMPAEPEFHPTRFPRFARKPPGEPPKPTRSQTVLEYVLFIVFGALFVLAGIALYTSYAPSYKRVPNHVAEGLKNDRLNILVFGIGGEDHPTHDQLADSIILLSLKPSTRQAAIVSVPRDLWVHIASFGTHRINYAHEAGQMSGYPGGGPGLLCDTVARTFNQPVHAYVRVDFAAFEKIIDDIGGVDVNCQRGFYDFLFKDGFAAGWHHLNGKRALAYARYRYILGPEGDNFAREMRQQQVLSAVREKLQRLSPQAVVRLIGAASTLSSNTTTNLSTPQMVTLYRTFHDIKPQNIRHVSLKPVTELFEVTRLAEPGTAVRTRTGDDRELQALEAQIFNGSSDVRSSDQIRITSVQTARPAAARSALSP